MAYGTDPDPYIDPETGVLKNLLSITDQKELDEVEANITATVIASIPENPIAGNFDLAHLQAIHKELFGDIYEWAGKIRTVEMSRDNTRFANSAVIESAARKLFEQLQTENLLKDLPLDDYVERLAYYYSEVNILHPFREGNGRTQRVFFTLLSAEAGYRLTWESIDPEKNVASCAAAYSGDLSKLAEMLRSLLKPQGGS